MEYDGDIFFDSLMKWMSTFSVSARRDSAESLCDGVAMAQVKIYSTSNIPQSFSYSRLTETTKIIQKEQRNYYRLYFSYF